MPTSVFTFAVVCEFRGSSVGGAPMRTATETWRRVQVRVMMYVTKKTQTPRFVTLPAPPLPPLPLVISRHPAPYRATFPPPKDHG